MAISDQRTDNSSARHQEVEGERGAGCHDAANANKSSISRDVLTSKGGSSRDDSGVGGSGTADSTVAMNNHDHAYGWLEPPRHDPIATDTNLAEIDFEDFRNEDLAYAFSCGVSLNNQQKQNHPPSQYVCLFAKHHFVCFLNIAQKARGRILLEDYCSRHTVLECYYF